jgi:type II secretory pathway pseudopilin PulG
MEDNRMDSLTSNSKIKNLFLIILLSILFTITAISLQHPITTQADTKKSIEATNNSKQFSSNETDQSANVTAGPLYWAASEDRSGFLMYVSNNEGSTEWTKAFFDKGWCRKTEDYANTSLYVNPVTNLRTCATQQAQVQNYTYLNNASTVYYDNGWQSKGSSVADWLVTEASYNGGSAVIKINGEEYTYQNWMDLIVQDTDAATFMSILQPLVDSVNDDLSWHVFFEPVSIDYLYTDNYFSSSTTDGYGRSYSAGDPIPSYTGDLNGEWYPTVYRCCANQFLQSLKTYVNRDTGTSDLTYKFYNQQLPFSLCLEDEIVLKSAHSGEVYADLKECTTTIPTGYSNRLTVYSEQWNNQYGCTLNGIGVSSIDLKMFLVPIHTYHVTQGSPGNSEETDDDTSGTCTIVKHYYTVTKTYDSDGNLTDIKYEDTGRYVRYQTTNYVVVMDEASISGYQLIEWATSDSELTVSVPNQGEEGTIKFTNTANSKDKGTEPKDDLYSQQDFINLILVNEETDQDEDDLDDYFEITESTLTKRVNFSQVTLKLKEATFKWTRNQFDSKAA